MNLANRRKENVGSLKSLCIQNIELTYKLDFNIRCDAEIKNYVSVYNKLAIPMSKQVFCKNFGCKYVEFHKFLWFLRYFVWDLREVDCYKTHFRKHNIFLTEVNFVGCNYLDGQMCILLVCHFSEQYKVAKLKNKCIKHHPNMHDENIKINNKSLKLTVSSHNYLVCHHRGSRVPE